MKLTAWFPARIKPVRKGIYETKFGQFVPMYQYWNGKYFGFFCKDIDKAYKQRVYPSQQQNVQWRGILK